MSADRLWESPPAKLSIGAEEVHLWRAALRQEGALFGRLREALSPEEQARAARFHFDRDRHAYIVARGLLREILARYLNTQPARLVFRYSAYGKPALDPDLGGSLRFNLSHSGQLVLYAVAGDREVGIDIEQIRQLPRAQQIADRYFSEAERAQLRRLPTPLRKEAFFACWTRKEAYIKARGQGFSLPLDQFSVSPACGGPMTVIEEGQGMTGKPRWWLCQLHPGPGYAAALAVEGEPGSLRYWQWCETNR